MFYIFYHNCFKEFFKRGSGAVRGAGWVLGGSEHPGDSKVQPGESQVSGVLRCSACLVPVGPQ